MKLPVEVQYPCKPKTARVVGEADEDLTPEEVAEQVGVPEGCFLTGKVIRGRRPRWSLVAYVKFRERA